ncbi:hypothetical protein FOA43_001206 [Brettanomyces nanus]|uniref:Uncharacterized protein n=1 Tax=Eeniella nana TaxID=13502 RepID=A0A875RWY7_EENNA|nr:uncharacterized protein FOA43_001206 [Brettanomyces nanus]QPG73891.1 hypothetical protein FOA43_001206 [Brettanomyces nanus]
MFGVVHYNFNSESNIHSMVEDTNEKKSTVDVSVYNADSSEDLDTNTKSLNPFADPKEAERWRAIYESSHYENLKYFDPEFEWTPQEEKRLIRKLDFKVFCWVFIMFCALDLVRRNVTRAIADNFLADLGMNNHGYNLGQTIYLLSFLCAELPMNILSKRLGPERVIPFEILAWSIVCICQAGMKNQATFIGVRSLLGFLQGGFIPDMILYLSYFYNGVDLPLRLSIFWIAIPLFQIVGSLMASGILELRGTHGMAGWQYLFIIEGFISFGIAIPSFYLMRTGPSASQNRFTKKRAPWFNEKETKILVNRILRDDPSKGDMNNRQSISWKHIFRTLASPDMWPIFIQGITAFIPFQPVSQYISLILKGMGYSTFMSNVLAIPGQFWFLINLPAVVYLSHKLKEKSLCAGIANLFILPFVIAIVAYPVDGNKWVKYVLLTGIVSEPYTHAILAAWVSQISNNVGTRAVATAIYNMTYQVGSIIAANIYQQDDKPYYKKGNQAILGICCFNIAMAIFTKFYYMLRNKQKAAVWNALSPEEQKIYKETTTDIGFNRLDFQFVH